MHASLLLTGCATYPSQVVASVAADVHLLKASIVLADASVHPVEAASKKAFLAALTREMQRLNPDVLVNFSARRNEWRALSDAWVEIGEVPFEGWSRVPSIPTEIRQDTADNARVTLTCPGRIEFDVQAWLQRNQSIKIRSYDLDDVVREFLKREPSEGCEGRAKDVIDLLNTASPKNKSFQVGGVPPPLCSELPLPAVGSSNTEPGSHLLTRHW